VYKWIGTSIVVILILSTFSLAIYAISNAFNDMDIKGIILVSILLVMGTGIYKKCNQLNPKRHVYGFMKQYWADMKCTYVTVLFALLGVFIGVSIIKSY